MLTRILQSENLTVDVRSKTTEITRLQASSNPLKGFNVVLKLIYTFSWWVLSPLMSVVLECFGASLEA